MARIRTVVVWSCLGTFALAGCRGKDVTPAPTSGADGLKEIHAVYKFLEYERIAPPQQVDDLVGYVDSMPNALPRIRSGEYEVAWGVGLATAPPASGGVLAFEKKAATEGGAVLLRDGAVKQMTAQEFAQARQIR